VANLYQVGISPTIFSAPNWRSLFFLLAVLGIKLLIIQRMFFMHLLNTSQILLETRFAKL